MAHLVCHIHGRRSQVSYFDNAPHVRVLHRSDRTSCEGDVKIAGTRIMPDMLVFARMFDVPKGFDAYVAQEKAKQQRARNGGLNVRR